MADHPTKNTQDTSDEIDLGQLFQIIGKGFRSVFRGILRVFLYLKKNAILLTALTVLGGVIGYGLSKVVSKKLKIEVIVKPQMESKNYLYEVVNEIQANISAKDTAFFKSIGLPEIDFNGLEITINKVKANEGDEADAKYLELLQTFENTSAISDIVRAELQNKSSLNHRITFLYKNPAFGKDFAEKALAYINENKYFEGLITIYRSNAISRIADNQKVLTQVDEIIEGYAKNIGDDKQTTSNDRIVLDTKERLDITGLFELKNSLIRDIESKKIELEDRTEVIKVINFGSPHPIKKSFFGKIIILVPFVFLGIFFLITLFKFLNRKAKEL